MSLALSPICKVPLLLFQALGFHIAYTPPQPPPRPVEQEVKPSSAKDRYMIALALPTVKGLLWGISIVESAIVLAHHFPSHPLSERMLSIPFISHSASASRAPLPPLFIFATCLTAFGGFVRYMCYRELGKYFTFELSIDKEHRLVTCGPYSWVRHPGYSAAIAAVIGVWITYAHPHGMTWFRDHALPHFPAAKVAAGLWSFLMGAAVFGMLVRTPTEDKLIQQKFGKQWAEWARNVPYKLVPFIY